MTYMQKEMLASLQKASIYRKLGYNGKWYAQQKFLDKMETKKAKGAKLTEEQAKYLQRLYFRVVDPNEEWAYST